jgi:hypothetical protein
MSAVLSREAILAADDQKTEKVEVPEWGGCVYVRSMSAYDRDQYEAEQTNLKKEGGDAIDLRNFRARLVARTACDADGNRLFTNEDAEALGSKSALAMSRLFKVASRLNGLTDKDLTDLEKNS